ncbi:MAG: tripartite tricarboxylate transporter TctB family protein [Thermodesulfobacteriota bacterium]
MTISRQGWFGISGIILSAIMYLVIIPESVVTKEFGEHNYSLSQAFFPKLVAIFLALLCAALIVKDIRHPKLSSPEDRLLISDYYRIGLVLLITILYIFTFEAIGYYIVTPIALLALLMVLGVRNVLTLILLPVVTTGATYLLFEVLLDGTLPRGLLG